MRAATREHLDRTMTCRFGSLLFMEVGGCENGNTYPRLRVDQSARGIQHPLHLERVCCRERCVPTAVGS